MTKNRNKIPIPDIMEGAAEHYANELDAQFRTLNNFVKHGGEIGRAHEHYLRGILSRFLPGNLRHGCGFIASPNWVSKQQDILIFKRKYTIFFEVGDCVVVDYESLVGTIEVKTNIDSSSKLVEAFQSLAELYGRYRNQGLRALYAWDGASYETTLNTLWDFVRQNPKDNHCRIPDLIYIRGKFLLLADYNNNKDAPPYRAWRVGLNGLSDGQALLGLVASIWWFGLPELPPWWLRSWHDYYGHLPTKAEPIEWPADILNEIGNR